ncbi:MAG: Ppx/GppA family phosphatase [Panacagrimonas sp.]|nr:Ppx/GppA phosphatase family protein [Panacagrimonas sp.]MCC2658342.1 Ppx/GppA family phosphatase [Panacagrimonas sp.]
MPTKRSPADDDSELQVAAVDLGSNSFHMLVARAQGGELQVIDRLREPVRLAAGLTPDLRLRPDAQTRALDCLKRFGQRLRNVPAQRVRAVGTSTLRRFKRGADFRAAAEVALGHSIEIISGVEEARLVYGGVTHGMGSAKPQRLVVDIGGGSTELIIGRDGEPRLMESVGLGCVVHQARFFEDGVITRSRFKEARLAARVGLEFLERRYRKNGWDLAIGSSGTVRGVWRVMRQQGWADQEITRSGLEKVVALVIERGRVDRIDFPDLREDRRPVFAGGLAVLAGVFDSLELDTMETSERALREGLVYDLLGRLSDHDMRDRAVAAMAARYAVDVAHAETVRTTAIKLLRQAQGPWQLDPKLSAALLGWAATLHEIGLVIAHSQYHKHGEYILRHADLQGFSQTDQRLLAALVRLHRSKFAVTALDELPGSWVEPIQRLAILFRLAFLLHRSREPGLKPPVRLKVNRRSLDLGFTGNWLAKHPLTQADLAEEVGHLQAAQVRLRIG